jgi:hypothetical protein
MPELMICMRRAKRPALLEVTRNRQGECGITSGGQEAAVTMGHSESDQQPPQVAVPGACVWSARKVRGLLGAPQNPHKSATRQLIPTGIPRTKRHTPVHLLCVLKARRTAGQQRRCA